MEGARPRAPWWGGRRRTPSRADRRRDHGPSEIVNRWTAAFLLLLILAVPWYWPGGITASVLGVPVWVLVSLLVGLLAAGTCAWLCLSGEADDGGPR